jgi:chaperone required for assembly of F1-ATPase
MKRFWTDVTVVPVDGAYAVMLDGKPMRLPGGPALRLQSAGLAGAIAEEWAAAGEQMSLEDLNLTRLAGTAQARVAPDPAPSVAALAAYAESDVLCYRAETPDALVAQQEAAWQPWLDWGFERYGARLVPVAGVLHMAQPEGALVVLRDAVAVLDPFALTGLGIIAPALGSLVLGLAVLEGAVSAEAAYETSILDELFQENLWGVDREALARRRLVARDVAEAARFVALARA